MTQNIRRIVCWNCEKVFRVDLGAITQDVVVVYRGRKKEEQTPAKKLVVECPFCQKPNEIVV